MLQRPFYPTFTVRRPVSASPCHSLQNKDAHSMADEISESGWTMYLDHSLGSWSNKNSSDFDIHRRYREGIERYPTCYYPAARFISSEESSSMASDASSGPQSLPLPLPVQDIEFEQERQGTRLYSSLSKRKRDIHVDKRENLECVASCSSEDVNPRKNKFRKLYKIGHADRLLEDTASSSACHLPKGKDVNASLESLQSLLHVGSKVHTVCMSPNTNFDILSSTV